MVLTSTVDYGVESVPEFVEDVDDINDTLPPTFSPQIGRDPYLRGLEVKQLDVEDLPEL